MDGMRPYLALKSATNFLFAALSRSGLHCAEFFTPSADSPTAARMSWSKEKPGPNSGTAPFSPACSYCLMKLMPMPPG
ncbi:hypothetical protein D3C71_1894180 [compost metagenome]